MRTRHSNVEAAEGRREKWKTKERGADGKTTHTEEDEKVALEHRVGKSASEYGKCSDKRCSNSQAVLVSAKLEVHFDRNFDGSIVLVQLARLFVKAHKITSQR